MKSGVGKTFKRPKEKDTRRNLNCKGNKTEKNSEPAFIRMLDVREYKQGKGNKEKQHLSCFEEDDGDYATTSPRMVTCL